MLTGHQLKTTASFNYLIKIQTYYVREIDDQNIIMLTYQKHMNY